jgi:DNA adenine methylase
MAKMVMESQKATSVEKSTQNILAKPFLKWAGGKSQLLNQFQELYPEDLKQGLVKHYYEPFVGSGAVFFDIAQKFGIPRLHILDKNEELILVYDVIQKKVEQLIDALADLHSTYMKYDSAERKSFYYEIRESYNKSRTKISTKKLNSKLIERAAQMIFLNKTCFNGLFRINSQGAFNVPYGRYSNPKILDAANLTRVSTILQGVDIRTDDFSILKRIVAKHSFVYFDPPYRPLSQTSNFTSYNKHIFGDDEQHRLAETFKFLDSKGCKLMLSNSDPKNTDPNDDFFENLYVGFNIHRVPARRAINSIAAKRGLLNELVITNYPTKVSRSITGIRDK